MKALVRRTGLLVAGFVLVAGCGSEEADVSSEVSEAASALQSAGESAASAAESATSSIAKVSANEASKAELVAALTAAGVDNPDKWADEVIEYRPYPPDDPHFTKLRNELAKDNPGPGVVDKIVSALEL
jgi:DNA uptake protein ComE-like DNA-binding protein